MHLARTTTVPRSFATWVPPWSGAFHHAISSPNGWDEPAAAYGIPAESVDGNDVIAVYAATRRAVDRARRGEGPTLIEAKTFRMRGHAEHDDASYVPKELFEEWEARDPITLLLAYLRE